MTTAITLDNIHLPGRAEDPDFHLATYQAGAGPAVVFYHGFPDVALGWRQQLEAVAEQGFHAIAPDMRGYGGSSCPHDVDAYALAELTLCYGHSEPITIAVALHSAVQQMHLVH